MVTISDIRVKEILDESPDISWIGEYTDDPDNDCICRHCGEYLADIEEDHNCPSSNREYNYFRPYAGGEKPGSKNYRKYGMQDFEYMEKLARGECWFVGIQAEAIVSYSIKPSGHSRLEKLTSGGIWGIDSDAEKQEFVESELIDLKDHLRQFNVDLSNWDELTEEIELTV